MSIKNDCKHVFLLDKLDFLLLSHISRNGEMFKKEIKLGGLSDRQTSRRIDALVKKDFLKIVENEIYRNMINKFIKKIGLTFKGCIAASYEGTIQENYLVKKYLNSIINKDETKNILSYIKKDVELFLKINRSIGITIDNMTNIIEWFEGYEELKSISKKDIERIRKIREEKNIIKKEIDLKFKKLDYTLKNSIMIDYDRWYEILEMFSNQLTTKKIAKKLIVKLSKNEKKFYDPKERAKRIAMFEKQTMESPQLKKDFEEVKKLKGKNFQEKFNKELEKQRKKLGLG
jgi:hypothetical protein